jgi:ubiquinone/menaquinone biosynthesis C-methylase UbiE
MAAPPQASPLADPAIWDDAADGYQREVAPGLALFAEDALRLAAVGPGMRIADVACGPGSLSFAAARAGARASALDFSPEMIARLRAAAGGEGPGAVDAQVGDGMALPWADGTFDAAFSLFGLIFFPDRGRGLAELRRVLRPGGRAVVSSWVPADRVPVLAEVWRVLSAVPELPYSRMKPVMGTPEAVVAELSAAGLEGVEVQEVQHPLDVPSAVEYWRTLERSTPPLIATRRAVGPERWAALSAAIARELEAVHGPGPKRVPLLALLGTGTRPG